MDSSDKQANLEVRCVPQSEAVDVYHWLGGDSAALPVGINQGLFEAATDGHRIGALWASILPGRSASITGPKLDECPQQANAARLLIREANRYLSQQQVQLAQAAINDGDDAIEWFAREGFQHAITVDWMACSPGHDVATDAYEPPKHLVFETYDDAMHDRLARLLEQTSRNSGDRAMTLDPRAAPEVLTGYRAVGRYSPDRWMILHTQQRDVGCLLMSEHPAEQQLEIVYLGVVPAARRAGLGHAAIRFAQYHASLGNYQQLILAVDAQNAPAQALYQKAGLICWKKHTVMLRVFG
jgi:ribosomal protein S18 acetylase RimI-like enzyme